VVVVASYDLTKPVGQTRLHIPDTDTTKPMFSDAEIDFLLKENKGNVKLAAAAALDIIAGDPARLSQWSRGGVSATRGASSEDLRRRAQDLRNQATGTGGIVVGTIERSDFW